MRRRKARVRGKYFYRDAIAPDRSAARILGRCEIHSLLKLLPMYGIVSTCTMGRLLVGHILRLYPIRGHGSAQSTRTCSVAVVWLDHRKASEAAERVRSVVWSYS